RKPASPGGGSMTGAPPSPAAPDSPKPPVPALAPPPDPPASLPPLLPLVGPSPAAPPEPVDEAMLPPLPPVLPEPEVAFFLSSPPQPATVIRATLSSTQPSERSGATGVGAYHRARAHRSHCTARPSC